MKLSALFTPLTFTLALARPDYGQNPDNSWEPAGPDDCMVVGDTQLVFARQDVNCLKFAALAP